MASPVVDQVGMTTEGQDHAVQQQDPRRWQRCGFQGLIVGFQCGFQARQ